MRNYRNTYTCPCVSVQMYVCIYKHNNKDLTEWYARVPISVIFSPFLKGVTPLELVMLEGSGLMGICSAGYEHLKEEFVRAGNG